MGKRGPQRGIKLTEEHKENIRKAKLKYKPTKEHIENARNGLIKHIKENYSEYVEKCKHKKGWKHRPESRIKTSISLGGRSEERFYGMTKGQWREKQLQIKERDKYKCQNCGIKGTSKTLNVHHINPYKYSKDNSDKNLITFCIPCHGKIEHSKNFQKIQKIYKQANSVK